MQEDDNSLEDFLRIKVIQGGKTEFIELDEYTRGQKFKEVLFPLFKKYKMKKKDAFLTLEDGRFITPFEYNRTVDEIIEKFGLDLKLYDEKQI